MTYIAIDPGKKCGVAIRVTTSWQGPPWACDLTNIESIFRAIDCVNEPDRVTVFLEKMSGTWRGSKDHRGHANLVIAAVKRVWPRRNKIHLIEPKVWQAAMLKNVPGKDTKEQSINRAKIDGHNVTDHNEADAVNILNYGLKHLERSHDGR